MSTQLISTARFDAEAASWEANEKHLDGIEKAFEAIKQHVPAFAEGRAKGEGHLELSF